MATPTEAVVRRIRLYAVGDPLALDELPDETIITCYGDPVTGNGDVEATAAAACDILAAGAAKHFRWSADGASLDMTMRAKQYRDTAEDLRRRISARTGGIVMSRAAATSDEWSG